MPKEIYIDQVFDLPNEAPIPFICGLVSRIGSRSSGQSQYRKDEEWSFQGITICDPQRPTDKITAMFKDRPPFPADWMNRTVCLESTASGKGVKAKDDNVEGGGSSERVVWVTGAAKVYLEDEGPAHASREPRRREPEPERDERRPRREPEPERPARREREEEPRRREPEREPRRRQEEPPHQEPPQRERQKHVEITPKVQLFKMALMMIECDKSAAWVEREITLERVKTNPDYKMTQEEAANLRSSLIIQAFRANLHTQFHPPLKAKPTETTDPAVQKSVEEPNQEHPVDNEVQPNDDDDIPY